MSLKYEPASEQLHIYVRHLFSNAGAVFSVPPAPAYVRETWTCPDGHRLPVDLLQSTADFGPTQRCHTTLATT